MTFLCARGKLNTLNGYQDVHRTNWWTGKPIQGILQLFIVFAHCQHWRKENAASCCNTLIYGPCGRGKLNSYIYIYIYTLYIYIHIYIYILLSLLYLKKIDWAQAWKTIGLGALYVMHDQLQALCISHDDKKDLLAMKSINATFSGNLTTDTKNPSVDV